MTHRYANHPIGALFLVLFITSAPLPAQATNGYFSHGFGTKSKAIGRRCGSFALGLHGSRNKSGRDDPSGKPLGSRPSLFQS